MPVPSPAEAEAHLRKLLAKHGLPPPDEVVHRVGEVVLVYREQEVAFTFELREPWPDLEDEE